MVTTVVPTGKLLPETGLATTEAIPQLSEPDGRMKLTAVPFSFVVNTLMSAGQAIVGRVTSWTVTTADAVAWLPLASVTVRVTVLAPTFEQSKLLLSRL